MGRHADRFAFIIEHAVNDSKLNNREAVQFHYFNPNGIYAACKVMKEEVRRLVDQGDIKSGWLIAYDCQHSINGMIDLIDKKRVSSRKFKVWKEMFIFSIESGYKALVERA